MRRRPVSRLLIALIALGLALGVGGGATSAAFFSTTSNGVNSFTAAPDWVAPTVNASVIQASGGGTPGFIRQGGTYFVYASVTDSGNPASGTATVRADLSTITTGATNVALAAGSWTVGGATYNYRSAQQTANAGLSAGSKSYTITTTDNAGNSGTTSGFSVTVDNTGPAASDIQAVNGSGVASRADQGDVVTFTFTEVIEPGTILAAWSGTATTVTVQLQNSGGGGGGDRLQVWNAANNTVLPLGSVSLGRSDYVQGATINYTNSTMVQSGSQVIVTLGTPSRTPPTAAGAGTMRWTPTSTMTDTAGNPCSTAQATESGAPKVNF